MSIRKQLISGVFFTALSKYANVICSLLVTAVLSRIMLPEQFGVMAVATVLISFLSIFADIGLTATIIQYKELQKKDLSILFSISLYLGIALSVMLFFGGYFLAYYYDEAALVSLCQWMAIHLFFSTLSVVPNALFYKDQLFKQIAVRTFAAQWIAGLAAVVWALYFGGIYALVVGPIISSILIFMISYKRYPLHFYYKFSFSTVAHTLGYSLYQFLFNIINFFSRNMDTLLVGKVLGASSLGYYDKAYRLMSLPLQNITQVITPVLHPLLSAHKMDSSYLRKANESMSKMLAIIGFPLSVLLYYAGQELIILFFGEQWYPAVPVFQYLSLTVGIQLILSSSGSFFQTAGDTRSLFICGIFSAILNVSAILFGVFYFGTMEAVALALLGTFCINFIQAYLLLYYKVFKVSSLPFFKLLLKPLFFSAILALVYHFLIPYVSLSGHIEGLIWKSALYVLAMLAILYWGGYKDEILNLIKRKQLPEG